MSKNFNKFLISILAVSALAFGAFHNDASASFWDWFKLGGNSEETQQTQQATAIANAEVESTLTINKSGSGSGTVSIKTSSGLLLKSCDFSSASSCEYSSSDGNSVFLYVSLNSGSSFGGITNCASSNLSSDNISTGHCNVLMNKSSTVIVTFNSGSLGGSSSSSSSSSSPSSSSSSFSYSTNLKVVTESAEKVTSNSATLKGTINPKGENAYYRFYYVQRGQPDTQKTTTWTSVSGSSDTSVSANISGLSSDTTYNFAISVYSFTSKKFTRLGGVKSFTTSESGTSSSSSSSSSSAEQYSLKVKISGAGKVSGSGISCAKTKEGEYKEGHQGICNVKINKGTEVTLYISEPSTQYEFATWADDCRSFNNKTSCNFKMSGDKTVSATFNKKAESGENAATVSVRKTGEGEGKVISVYIGGENSGKEDGRINCGSDCSENFKQYCETEVSGDRRCGQVYFKAVPEKGSTFGGWSNCLTFRNEKDQCYVILDGDKTISANFSGGGEKSSSSSSSAKSSSSSLTSSANHTATTGEADYYSTGATLYGTVNPGGENVYYIFSYYKSGTSGTTKYTAWKSAGSGTSNVSASASVSDLSPGTTYNYQISAYSYATNKYVYGVIKSFTTPSSSTSSSSSSSSSTLTAKTGSADNITSTSARLQGSINPQGENVSVYFNYRKESESSDATKATAWMSTGSRSSDFLADIGISNLSPGTKYIYRFYAYSYTSGKTVSGDIGLFTTLGSSSSSSSSSSQTTTASTQTATTNYATNVTSTSATLNGTVNPGGENVSYYFAYYKSGTSAMNNTSFVSAGNGTSNVSGTANISGLTPGTTYYYYVSAYSYTAQKTFTGVNSTKSFTTPSSSTSSSSSSSSSTLTAKTGSADNITSTSARLQGSINPQGENVSVYFNYRKESESSDATKATAWMSTGSRSSDFLADIGISNLSPGTKYIYRFYAYSYTSGKTVSGDIGLFTTLGSSSSSSSSQTTTSAVSGSCGSTVNACSVGNFAEVADTSTYYYWNCQGLNGGSSRTCSLVKPASSSSSISSSSSSLPIAYPITVSKAGTGIGVVTAPGISCPSDCAENYPSGATITLIATPATGSVFTGWIGCNASSGTVCSILMNSSKSIIANFVKP